MTMVKVVSRKVPKTKIRSKQQPFFFFFIFELGWKKTLLTIFPLPNLMNSE